MSSSRVVHLLQRGGVLRNTIPSLTKTAAVASSSLHQPSQPLRIDSPSTSPRRPYHYHAGPYHGYYSYGHPGLENMKMHGTTILCVRKGDQVVMMGDGQVSQGATVVKPNAKKVRRIGEDIIAGFAGSTADCFTLMERLERKLEEHPGQLTRACVDLAKAWRTDKYLRRLEASLIVADTSVSFEITGLGDVLEPKDGVIAIGSGGTFALAAAKALLDRDDMDAKAIAQKAMEIAAEICVYTNTSFTTEVIEANKGTVKDSKDK